MSREFLFKILVFGHSGVGKTSIINRYIDNEFGFSHVPTIGVEFRFKDLTVDDQKIRLQIWDSCGQKSLRMPFTTAIYKNSSAFIVAYDLTDLDSLQELLFFIEEIENHANENPLIVIVGNKADLPSNIENPEEKIKELTNGKNYKTFRTSAKESTNVDELFFYLIKKMKKNAQKMAQSINDPNKKNDFITDDQFNNLGGFRPNPLDEDKGKKCC
ncbi:ras-related protein rab-37 [Anaeramoeba ignava]|uniref:Ras-related protein rab-37 n=1 Tax=Anaeramoeba ignava TaxID=1746090 RepID=A0A9Q0LM26_ANAIG|nr:ras-related protein rab-37 [Anaeramoeba ignava]